MQPKFFTLNRHLRAQASARSDSERTVLRIDREALKSATPQVRFAAQS